MHRPFLRWRVPAVLRGFTLVELLVALAVMALLALLGWRAGRYGAYPRAHPCALTGPCGAKPHWRSGADLDALQPLEHQRAGGMGRCCA